MLEKGVTVLGKGVTVLRKMMASTRGAVGKLPSMLRACAVRYFLVYALVWVFIKKLLFR